MTTSEPHEQPPTPPPAATPPPEPAFDETRPLVIESAEPAVEPVVASEVASPVPQPAPLPPIVRVEADTVYVPLSVTIGDGFKFGCGFFLALVMAMLVGFVLLAVLFVLSSLVGLNLPITR